MFDVTVLESWILHLMQALDRNLLGSGSSFFLFGLYRKGFYWKLTCTQSSLYAQILLYCDLSHWTSIRVWSDLSNFSVHKRRVSWLLVTVNLLLNFAGSRSDRGEFCLFDLQNNISNLLFPLYSVKQCIRSPSRSRLIDVSPRYKELQLLFLHWRLH